MQYPALKPLKLDDLHFAFQVLTRIRGADSSANLTIVDDGDRVIFKVDQL